MACCTVLTPDVANAAFPSGPQTPACPYVIATPNGLFAVPTFDHARQTAELYVQDGLATHVNYL